MVKKTKKNIRVKTKSFKHKHSLSFYLFIILSLFFAILIITLTYILSQPYPVEIKEKYIDKIPYNVVEYYTKKIPVKVQEEKFIEVPYIKTEKIPYGFNQLDKQVCEQVPFNYEVIYYGNLSENKFDYVNNVGFRMMNSLTQEGIYRQKIKICNLENEDLYINFLICNYGANKEIACNEQRNVRIPKKTMDNCLTFRTLWRTRFDPGKSISIKVLNISKKTVCKTFTEKKRNYKTKILTSYKKKKIIENKTIYKEKKYNITKTMYKEVEKVRSKIIYLPLWKALYNKYVIKFLQ